MNRLRGLLLSIAAGVCAAPAAAQGPDDITHALSPRKIDRVFMHGLINGDAPGFGARAGAMDCFSNVDLGPNSWVFFGGTVHTSGEPIFTEKGGVSALGVQIGPVAGPARARWLEFWVVASDGTTGSHGVPCTITYEMFDTTMDWNHFTCEPPLECTCFPHPEKWVNVQSLGGFYVPLTGALAPINGHANGYVVDLGAAGMPWALTDGNFFIDANGTAPPTALSRAVYTCYDGSAMICGAPAGFYPALGFSFDSFYFDANNDGGYDPSERYFYGGFPFIANLMFRIGIDDGCTVDLNGDGFVNGDDIGYAEYVFYGGCPY